MIETLQHPVGQAATKAPKCSGDEETNNAGFLARGILLPQAIDSAEVVGAKAFSLKQLADKGFSVPVFCCVPCGLLEEIGESIERAEDISVLETALDIFIKEHFPDVLLFSVRSSSNAEDTESASFAGQFESFLRVPGEQLAKTVVRCWKTMQAGAIDYAQARGLAPIAGGSVIIQEMVEADLAGIAFSANPQGLLNEAVVVCGASTGDLVVEDKVPTTTYYFNLSDNRAYFEQQSAAPLLASALLDELIAALKYLSKDKEVDLEFAVKDDRLWFLQMRPITTLPEGEPLVLDNSNIVESYPGLSLPLTISFARYVYYQVFSGLARRCMPSAELVLAYDSTLQQMVNSANGRLYYQISNWYTLLKFLPFQKKIIPIWQRMLGVENTSYDNSRNLVTPTQHIRIWRNIIASIWNIPGKMDHLQQDFERAVAKFNEGFSPHARSQDLVALYDDIASIVTKDWDVTLLNDLYAFIYTHLLERQFKKAGIEDYQQYSNRSLVGNHELESMKPVEEALRLAKIVAADAALRSRLAAMKSNEDVEAYLEEESSFSTELLKYLDVYGDRCLEELKLETRSFRSDPITLVEMLLAYASVTPDKARGSSDLATAKESPTPPLGFFRRKLVKYFKTKAALGIANREKSRLNRTRLFGMVRSIFAHIGRDLAVEKLIETPRDIFYLTIDEVFSQVKGEADGADFRMLIARRKEEYRGFEQLPEYTRLVFAEEVFDKHACCANEPINNEHAKIMRGTPCSSGIVEAEALVVLSPVSAEEAKGKILIARTTDPGWVYLLAVAKGIVAEKGSLLSHTAIVSRELGLPSVVGVDRATERIQTGDVVRLDGNGGTVEICS